MIDIRCTFGSDSRPHRVIVNDAGEPQPLETCRPDRAGTDSWYDAQDHEQRNAKRMLAQALLVLAYPREHEKPGGAVSAHTHGGVLYVKLGCLASADKGEKR